MLLYETKCCESSCSEMATRMLIVNDEPEYYCDEHYSNAVASTEETDE